MKVKRRIAALSVAGAVAAMAIGGAGASSTYSPIPQVVASGGIKPYAAAINSVTHRVYAVNTYTNSVGIINEDNNTLITTLPTGQVPAGVAVDEVLNKIYVSHYGYGSPNGTTVEVIDGATNGVQGTIALGTAGTCDGGCGGIGIGVNQNTHKVYVANFGSNNVSIIDGNTNTLISHVAVGTWPLGVAVNSTTGNVYVTNYASSSFSVIDGTTNAVSATIVSNPDPYNDLGHLGSPWGVGVNELTNQVFVVSNAILRVTAFDGATNNPTHFWTVNGGTGLAVDARPGISIVWVANYSSNSLQGFNGSVGCQDKFGNCKGKSVGSVNIGLPGTKGAIGAAVNRATGDVYGVNSGVNDSCIQGVYQDTLITLLYNSVGVALCLNPQNTSNLQRADPGLLAHVLSEDTI